MSDVIERIKKDARFLPGAGPLVELLIAKIEGYESALEALETYRNSMVGDGEPDKMVRAINKTLDAEKAYNALLQKAVDMIFSHVKATVGAKGLSDSVVAALIEIIKTKVDDPVVVNDIIDQLASFVSQKGVVQETFFNK